MSEKTISEARPAEGTQMFRLVDAQVLAGSTSDESCGCGGHGGGAAEGGCGCGGHGGAQAPRAGHHHGAGHARPLETDADGLHVFEGDELVVHSIPRVVRHAVLFAAVDNLPVGESLTLVTPHQPEPLFEHLRESEAHYRVTTLAAGPAEWRYEVTRRS